MVQGCERRSAETRGAQIAPKRGCEVRSDKSTGCGVVENLSALPSDGAERQVSNDDAVRRVILNKTGRRAPSKTEENHLS